MHSWHTAAAVRRPGRPRAGRLALLLALAFTIVLASAPLSDARRAAAHGHPQATPPVASTVTLITGDVVHMLTRRDGRRSFSFEPGADGTIPDAAITEVGEHAYVVPRAAMSLVAAKRLDLDLFDVAGLVRQRYDDAHRATLPVIVDYGRGAAAAADARRADLAHARKTVTIASLGAAAFAADKEHARAFWHSLTAAGATRVDLDGRVRATFDPPVSQIHAPEAWAAGYDGSGSTVAVLDTGYDAAHLDLAGVVELAANFTTDATTADGNGHGTHVASTIAGTGAASARLHGGVAPGTKLLVGKVLADGGFGEDSWVLAGMQWAVEHGADVVSMSLGGEASDGSDPLSRAIDELSAASDTLFVVAAGNDGSNPGTITAPGSADAALTVGAVDGSDTLAYFSSRGPRLGDGAVKPDVVAPGVDIIAARAAGTELGRPVDEWYTSLDGTSMATPHVAGIAAIVKQRHPAWDGERIKAAITGSAVSVPSATAFEAGTGRVDALQALGVEVVSAPALNLGSYPWPQQDLQPTRTPLRYENLGVAPVTLALSVAAQDSTAGAPAGVSLSASTLTLAPGGTATVDVQLDPSVPGVGTFSGVVVADPGAGSSVRTAFGFSLESEHYDVTVDLRPRAGTRRASHLVGLVGLDNGFFEQRTFEGSGSKTTTFRVPPGTYSVGGLTFGLAADSAAEGVLAYEPSLSVSANTTVVLDEATARPFDVVTGRAALTDGQIMSVDWNGQAGVSNFTLAGAFDRLFAQPLASSSAGSPDAALNWMLSQPAAEIALPGAQPVLLRSLASGGRIDGAYRLVDAGTVAALDTSSVRRAIAVIGGSCSDLSAAATALEQAGAAAMVAYPVDGADCAGTLTAPAALAAYQVLPYDAARLLGSHRRPLMATTHDSPAYVYDLAGAWSGSVPPGATLDGRTRSVAAFVERYDSLGGTSAEGHFAWEMAIGWVPGRGSAAYGLSRPVAVPSTVTHYVSPVAEWDRTVEVRDAAGFPEGMLWAPKVPVRAGQTIRDRWFGGPVTPNVSPLQTALGWQASPYRQGDTFWLFMPTFTDDAGHAGFPIYLGEFEGKLFRDGEVMFEGDDPLRLQGEAPPEPHDYRLVYTNRRQNGFWQRSTMSESAWTFSSARTVGDHEVLPLMTVDFDLPVDALGKARPGPFSFGLAFGMPAEVERKPIARVTVDVSWDGGVTWRPAKLQVCAPKAKQRCIVGLWNLDSGSASLRVSATDTAGRSVTQTIVDAYVVERG